MKRHVIAASMLAVTITGTLGAQTAPARPIVKPSVNPSVAQTVLRPGTSTATGFMATGPYKLGLHAEKKNNQTISASDFDSQTSVSRSGNTLTITASDGMSLTGAVTGNQFHANGTSGTGGTLALTGAATSNGAAAGTFSAHDGTTTLTGTFTLYPGLNMGPTTTEKKLQNYGDPKPSSGGGTTCGFWCQLKQWFGL